MVAIAAVAVEAEEDIVSVKANAPVHAGLIEKVSVEDHGPI